jgi:hypothetical protein
VFVPYTLIVSSISRISNLTITKTKRYKYCGGAKINEQEMSAHVCGCAEKPLTKAEEEKNVHAGQHEICIQNGCPLKGKPIRMDRLTKHLAPTEHQNSIRTRQKHAGH